MKIADLKKDMDARFEQVDARFERVDARFEQVDARFESVETQLRALRAEMKTEAETTRRHMDIRAEEFRDYVKVLADGIARNTERLDNHEQRITAIERSGSSSA